MNDKLILSSYKIPVTETFANNDSYIPILVITAEISNSTGTTGLHFTKLEIHDSQNLAKLRHGCTTKLSDGGGEGIEFCFNWRCGWVATMVPNWELRSTFWFPFASM